MIRLTLFHTAGCHLCEEAESVTIRLLTARGLSPDCLDRVDIADDQALQDRYGVRIPVLRVEESGRELDWPFGSGDIEAILC